MEKIHISTGAVVAIILFLAVVAIILCIAVRDSIGSEIDNRYE